MWDLRSRISQSALRTIVPLRRRRWPMATRRRSRVVGAHAAGVAVAVTASCFLSVSTASAAPAHQRAPHSAMLSVDPANPHYLLFQGRPTVLVTSGEHYGAVINEDFDYKTYLRTLQHDHLNLTRVFSGEYREHVNEFTSINLPANTLGPLPNRYLAPWARSDVPGYTDGGNKFDLSRWDPAYFARLKDFVSQAAQRGVAVEIVLFCNMYGNSQWSLSPLNGANNVNGVGDNVDSSAVDTLGNGNILPVQDALVRKLATELNPYNNVYFEIENEPTQAGTNPLWQDHIVQTLTDTEDNLPNRQLIAKEHGGAPSLTDVNPAVSILDFEYAAPPTAATNNYGLDRVMADDETGFRGSADSTYRTEGWDFVVAGGGVYDNLDFSFTPTDPFGTQRPPADACCGGSPELRAQLGFLQRFVSTLPIERMEPYNVAVTGGPSTGTARVLAQPGKTYVVYFDALGSASHQDSISLAVPDGQYKIRWFDPTTGKKGISTLHETSQNYKLQLTAPNFTDDAVALVTRIGPGDGALPPTWTRVDNTATNVTYAGTWNTYSNGGCYGGSSSYSHINGDDVSYTFTGTGARWLTEYGPDHGKADVYVDGVLQVSGLDTYNPTVLYQQKAYEITGLTSGTHVLKIVVTNTKNANSTGFNESADAFEYIS